MQPSNTNLKAIVECVLPQTYTEVHAFLGLVGHYRRFIEGFAHIVQPLNTHLTGEGASRKSEWVSFPEDALKAFDALKQVYDSASSGFCWLYQTIFIGDWCVQRQAMAVLSQKQAYRWYHPVTYSNRALMPHKKNYHLTKLEFLVLKWMVTEHFKEYLPLSTFSSKDKQ